MTATVNAAEAEAILRDAVERVVNQGWQVAGPYSDLIQFVMLGTHKTYRYILLNALLAKATNEACNPLTLQAGSKLAGAFDARSLCHGVVVRTENELLGNRLGASNEPFLNKPARFTELASTNAVRRGNDTKLLHALIEILANTKTSNAANISLKDCIFWVFQRPSRKIADYVKPPGNEYKQSSLVLFGKKFVTAQVVFKRISMLL